ncbi:hypothetical protein CSX11_16975 [Mycobacterium goodii]|nr:hypothetical protein CSX11_16975 [Mycolicibacterium goodii]
MRDGAWLDAQEFPPVEYAVPGILPEGMTIIVAPPKAGKSWLCASIGLGCASGGYAIGSIKVTKRPVLYMALEDGHRRLQSRFRRLMQGEPIPPGMHVMTQVLTQSVIGTIDEFCSIHAAEKPLVLIDTLGRARPPRPAGADAYQFDYAVGARLKAAIDAYPGSSLLLVHHSRKQESSDFVDSVSGTAGVAGAADAVLVLTRARHSDEATLAVTGRDISENEYAMRCDDGLWRIDGADLSQASAAARTRRETKNLGDRSQEALAFVNQHPAGVGPSDLAKHLGINGNDAGTYLRRLFEAGRINRPTRGLYTPVSEAYGVSETDFGQGLKPVGPDSASPDKDTKDRKDTKTPYCLCGNALVNEESIKSGQCLECWYSGGAQ